MQGFTDYLERHLGLVVGGWSHDPDGVEMPFQLAEFRPPGKDVVVLMTLGISHHRLPTRLEIMMAMRAGDAHQGHLMGILDGLGRMILERHEPLELGILVNSPSLREFSPMGTLYTGPPHGYLPDHGTFRGDAEVSVHRLIPVHPAEADFIRTHDWLAFEEVLTRHEVDTLDLDRAPIMA